MPEITVTIPPLIKGATKLIELDNYTVLVERTTDPAPEPRPVLPIAGYAVVDIQGDATRVHAAALRWQRAGVRKRDDWTLCGSGKFVAFRVTRRRDELPLTVVSCSRCRKRLVSAGAIPPDPTDG